MFQHRLFREVALAVAIKTTLVIAAALFIFGPRQRPPIDLKIVEARILSATGQIGNIETREKSPMTAAMDLVQLSRLQLSSR
jgi:hypothetical protein